MSLDKAIIKAQAALATTFEYKARELNKAVSTVARNFVDVDANRSPDFKISGLVAEQAGISRLESDAVQDKINAQVLLRLADVQEKAYAEGFELGQTEGAERAFREAQAALGERLLALNTLIGRIELLKTRLLVDNEAELIRLLYVVASKIALRYVEQNSGSVLPVLTQVVGEMQGLERVTVNISAEDYNFIELLRQKGDLRVEPLQRAKLVVSPQVRSGGCTIETDYGDVDATIEERVERAWAALDARVPKNGPETTAASGATDVTDADSVPGDGTDGTGDGNDPDSAS